MAAQQERDTFWNVFDRYLEKQDNPFYVSHVKGGKNQAAGNINNPSSMAMQTICCEFKYRDQVILVQVYINHKVELFDFLYAKKKEVENRLGYEVEWIKRGLLSNTVRRIQKVFPIDKSYEKMVEEVFPYILDFIQVFEPYLKVFVN